MADQSARGLVLSGAAGVGKTRLAREAMAMASLRGWATEWAVASAAGSRIPFGAFSHLVPAGQVEGHVDYMAAAVRSLVERAGGRRLVVGVDDAHLLDDISASFVHNVVATGGAFVVSTLRTGLPVPEPVVALWKDGLVERIEVQALAEREVADLLAAVLSGPVDSAMLRKLWNASGGNVLYLRELVLGGLDTKVLRVEQGVWCWEGPLAGSRLVELVESRLGTLTAAERSGLEHLAYGEPLGLGVMAAIAGEGVVESLEASGLVAAEVDGRRTSVRLGHPLYGEVLRATTLPLRSRSIQRRLAELVRETGMRRRDDLLPVATWTVEGGGHLSAPLLTTAAGRALGASDPQLGERLARAALDAGGGIQSALKLSNALTLQGRHREGADALNGYDRAAMTDGERVRLTELRTDALFAAGEVSFALEILDDIESAVSGDENLNALVAQRTSLLVFSGQTRAAIDLAEGVLDRLATDERNLIATLGAVANAWAVAGRTQETLAVVDRWTAKAVESDELLVVVGWMFTSASLLGLWFAGRVAEAVATATFVHEASIARPELGLSGVASGLLGRILLVEGRVQDAARWLREGSAALRRGQFYGLQTWCDASLAQATALGGDFDPALADWAATPSDLTQSPLSRFLEPDLELSRAWVTATVGDVATARQLALRAAAIAAERDQQSFEMLALYDALRLGADSEVAARLRLTAGGVDGALAPALVAHADALASGHGGELDDIADVFERMDLLIFAAEASAHAAAAHHGTGRTASARSAAAKARRLRSLCQGARTPTLVGMLEAPQLTSRELEIALMAAQGMTNRAIADRLVVSVRTVDNHLHQAYTKLGIAGRAELPLLIGGPGGSSEGPGAHPPR
jgi:ATP/maltotriose-dependent transcriptional regulator MalT